MICMEKLSSPSGYSDSCQSGAIGPAAVGRLRSCQHSFHMLCMLAMYSNGNKVLGCPSLSRLLCAATWAGQL